MGTVRTLERDNATLRQARPGYPTETRNADGTVVKPDEGSIRAWRTTTGVPENADAYEIPLPEVNPYPDFTAAIKKGFHEVGVPAAMAPKLVAMYETAMRSMETKLRADEDAASTVAMETLKQEWGSHYAERLALSGRGQAWLSAEVGGLTDVQLRSMENLLGTPKFMAAMWKLGASSAEGRFAGGGQRPGTMGNTAADAQAELNDLQAQRTAGAISNPEWNKLMEPGGKLDQLRDRIVAGMAPQG